LYDCSWKELDSRFGGVDIRRAIIRHIAKLIYIDPLALQFLPRDLDFPHQFLVCIWYIVERKHTPTKLEEEIRSERHESPEWELQCRLG